MYKKRILYHLFLLFILACPICGQDTIAGANQLSGDLIDRDERTGGIKGKVTSETGEALVSANILIIDNNFGAATDENGNYVIKNLKPGAFTLSVTYIGFESQTQKIDVYSGRTTEVNIVLKSTSFNIGGIEVVGTSEFIPLDPETKTEITSGEIEHMQAASLGDVLQLMPGVATVNPTLNDASKAKIRGGDALGTQIIIDGVPISNTANMHSKEDDFGNATGGSGVDLRSIPAENIESVEIIRGIPSVRYGDLVDGAVIVKSKATPSPLRLKMKYNPSVYEANLSGGFRLSDRWIINGNFNMASSDREVKVDGDGYTRLVGQVNAYYDAEDIEFNNSFYVTRTFDEMEEQPDYASREAWYNRDLTLKYISDFKYIFNSLSELNAKASINFTKRNSFRQEIISRDNMVVSDRIEEGAQEGVFVFGSYLGKEWLKGAEWNLYADVNYETGFFTGEFLHKFLMGINWKDDFNTGDGYIFDPLYPIFDGYNTPRLRSFDDLPSFNTLSFYFEDKIAGRLFKPFTLQIGFRYESYRPDGINLEGLFGDGDFIESLNGTYFNPRVNFSYNLFKDTQIRLGYGVTSKAPPMYTIFSQDRYVDVVDTNLVVDPTDESANFAIVSTYIYQNQDEYLKGIKQYKYEAGIDQKIGPVGCSLTGFINKTKGLYRTEIIPGIQYKKSYPEWPNAEVYTTTDTIFYSDYRTTNNSELTSKGLEFSFKTEKIPVINTIFKLDASYSRINQEYKRANYRLEAERTVNELGGRLQPIYNVRLSVTENLLLNYRFDIQAKSLGMWITIHVQHNALDNEWYTKYDSVAIGYYTVEGELIKIPEEERGNEKYSILTESVASYKLRDDKIPASWLVNLKVSKSLWEGAAISFFVNNFLDNNPLYREQRSADSSPNYGRSNPAIFYGMEFQTSL
ncbi:MAG: TonB-dependent receptor [Ignavibacteria bacterium]|jgi:hypothetical protein